MDQDPSTKQVSLLDLVGIGYAVFLLAAILLIMASSVFLWRTSLDRPKFIDRMLTHAMVGLALWALAMAIAKYGLMVYSAKVSQFGIHVDINELNHQDARASGREMLAHFLLFLTTFLVAFIGIVAQARRRRSAKAGQEPV